MTEENYIYRTSQTMLRNQFPGDGPFQIPMIPKTAFSDEDFRDLLLIGFDRARADDDRHRERMVHFFLYDYKFERVWQNAEKDLERLKNYRAVLSPDFSMYQEMNPSIQLYNTFRNRWCGAYWADKGLRVISTVSWGNENTFDFCFKGIPKGSTVAVSTYMVSEHDNRCDQKDFFMKGYREMLRQIEPERIICYNTPFPEMEGNIVFVDYELSSWRYMNRQTKAYPDDDLECYKIGGANLQNYDTINVYMVGRGMGSAYGAQWKPNPNKPNDMALKGTANTVRRIYISTHKRGYWIRVKYGEDGWAVVVRHETTHSPGSGHTNPHDHIMKYDPNTHAPMWGSTEVINYSNGAPELKQLKESDSMSSQDFIVLHYDDEAMRFKTISEFKNSLVNGGEIVIEWNNVEYGIFRERNCFFIGHGTPDENVYYDTPDELLEYRVGNDRLRDVITKAIVVDRTL